MNPTATLPANPATACSVPTAFGTASPLAFAPPRSWQRVLEVTAAAAEARRLHELGLVPGVCVYVASICACGVVLQMADNARLAVDAALAEQVWVDSVRA